MQKRFIFYISMYNFCSTINVSMNLSLKFYSPPLRLCIGFRTVKPTSQSIRTTSALFTRRPIVAEFWRQLDTRVILYVLFICRLQRTRPTGQKEVQPCSLNLMINYLLELQLCTGYQNMQYHYDSILKSNRVEHVTS